MYAKLVFRNAKRSVKDYLIYIVTICFVETWQRSASCSCVKPASLRSLRTFSPSTFKSEFGIIVHLNSIVSFW